ncbi:MAG: precorrin-4 C(11)-methyltransferase [Lachnospiraceae bacterium]|nr:precorrin-4 C(11)-methyltransferase [Lachnospiraceae bacterium]
MVDFVGAGCGAEDLITLRGVKLLNEADVVIYAGSLVNPAILKNCREDCALYDSAKMTLEEVLDVIKAAEKDGKKTVRLHSGDPCLYGAIQEQMIQLDELGIAYRNTPGVSAFCGAAAALQLEYTRPGISQSVVITRMPGRTPVPDKESIRSFAEHHTTMVIFLSTGLLTELSAELIAGGYSAETPAAIVYKATWPEQQVFHCNVGSLAETAANAGIKNTALIIVGDVVAGTVPERSKLYDPSFTTLFREATEPEKA